MAAKKVTTPEPNGTFRLPGHAQIIAEIGHETTSAVNSLVRIITDTELLFPPPQDLFPALGEALKEGWNDKEAANVVFAIRDCFAGHHEVNLAALTRWLRVHRNNARAVIDCLRLNPPREVSIIQLLNRAGSPKLVFLANWEIAQQEVVLKSFIGDAERLIHRELQPHPLSMAHPNIIETHFLRNDAGEIFLVERRLPMVLSDTWESHGVQEAANLLRDIANALAFLQDKQLVHGDIKPDNIGFEEGNYILLDFGICRPSEMFAEDSTPTGSLRTRAPEVLLNEKAHSHASDVWALGATVYNSIVRRFPLFGESERPPRVSAGDERTDFERVLAERVVNEWSTRVDLSRVPEPLRDLLSKALERDSDRRITAAGLVEMAERELAAFLRVSEGPARFSPREEIDQLYAHLPQARVIALMPDSQKYDLKRRLDVLGNAKGLTPQQRTQIDELRSRL